MNHPEVFIIPVMMLADYYLTVWAAILSEKKYQQYFKVENLELNPTWQKDIKKKRKLNVRHLAIVVILAAFCFIWANGWKDPDAFSEGLFGFFVILFASVIANHISNILTFLYLNHHPEGVFGEVNMSQLFMSKTSQFSVIGLLFILTVIAIFSHTPFIIGAVFSQISRFISHSIWRAKAQPAEKRRIPPIISK